MRCALCTSVQALSRVGWCHRCARACAVYLVQERMDEAMTRARARIAAAYTDLLAWLNGSGGGGKNFPFHPSQAYHSWLLGRLIELRMHSQGFLQNVLWFHGKMLKQHQYRIVLLRKHFANF